MKAKKFIIGQSIVFEPSWAPTKEIGCEVYPNHPLKYGDIVLFLAYITPATGHCIITTYDGKVIPMLHPNDFRPATDDEV